MVLPCIICMPIPQSISIYLKSLTSPMLYLLMFLNIDANHVHSVLWHLVWPTQFAFICIEIFRLNTVFKMVKKTTRMCMGLLSSGVCLKLWNGFLMLCPCINSLPQSCSESELWGHNIKLDQTVQVPPYHCGKLVRFIHNIIWNISDNMRKVLIPYAAQWAKKIVKGKTNKTTNNTYMTACGNGPLR